MANPAMGYLYERSIAPLRRTTDCRLPYAPCAARPVGVDLVAASDCAGEGFGQRLAIEGLPRRPACVVEHPNQTRAWFDVVA